MRKKKARRLRNLAIGVVGTAVLLFAGYRLAASLRRPVSPDESEERAASATLHGIGDTLPAWRPSTLARLDELLAADRAGNSRRFPAGDRPAR